MNSIKPIELTEAMKNKIISAAYKDISWLDRILVWKLILQSKEAKNIFDSYRATANEVSKLDEDECPEFILDSVKDKTAKPGFVSDFYLMLFNRPIISLAATIIIVAVISFGILRNKQVEYEFTKAEIVRADKQAKLAFTIIGDVFKQTKSTIENDVLGNKVAKPLNTGFGIINNLFEGGKNEIN